MFKKKFRKEKKGLENSFKYAFEGIFACFKSERNMKIHVSILFIVVVGGFFFHISISEWITCLILFGLVLSAELVNTSIETTIDLCMPHMHPKAKIAKDTASGGVLILAIVSFIIGCIVFIPKIVDFISSLL